MATSTAPLPKRMRVKVAGRYWQLQFVNRLPKAWGVTDNPTRKNKGIRIRRSLKEADLLDTLIHELLHASQWSVGEDWVDKVATQTSLVLGHAGWARIPKAKGGSVKQLADLICSCLRLTKSYLDHDQWAIGTAQDVAGIIWRLGWRCDGSGKEEN